MNFKDNVNHSKSEEYLSDDYDPNEFLSKSNYNENKFIKGIIDNSLDNKKSLKFSKSVDVRIVLTDLSYIESISSTLNNFDLSNFNVVISSIIPTNDIEIAKNAAHGADLLLVATEFSDEGKKLFHQLKKSLKTDFNYIEYLKLPQDSDEDSKYSQYATYNSKKDFTEFFEDEISNSIIRAGLSCVSNLFVINQSKLKFFQIKEDYDRVNKKFEKITLENNQLIDESKSIKDKNQKLTEEVLSLQNELDKLKSDYVSYKSRFENDYSGYFLEFFSINELWVELFDEKVYEELYDSIILITNEFEPKDIIVGQGLIGAKNKENALDWLKIIKTALIVNDGIKDTSKNSSEKKYWGNNYSNRIYSEINSSSRKESANEDYSSKNNSSRNKFADDENDYDSSDDYNIDESFINSQDFSSQDEEEEDIHNMFSIF